MNTNSFFYPFDPTGSATTNLVSGERQVVNAPGILDFYYIVPKAGPYFRESLELVRYPSGAAMVEGVDYVCTHLFHAATHSTGKGVYGSITFYDHTLTGTVSLKYQTIGGDWVINEAKILEVLSNIQIDPRITTWEETVDVPFQFPVIAHEFNVDDFVGADDIVNKLITIKEAIIAASSGTAASHVLDFENPHRTTKAHVGLSFLDNFPTATLSQAQLGSTNSAFMTPLRTAQAIQALSWVRIDTHVQRVDNPHEVTKTQVGLGNVENLTIATTGEAEAGSSNARYMSPARTKDAINSQALVPLTTFINRRDNPNQVNASQVGLGNLSNFATGTAADAQTGTAADKFLAVREIITAISYHVKDAFLAHAANTTNPHGVTKSQVGLSNVFNYGLADLSAAEAGTSNELYMTPWATRQLFLTLGGGGGGDTGHSLLTDNPHGVTKVQIGLSNVENYAMASKLEAEIGVLSTTYMSPARTKEAIQYQIGTVLDDHVLATDNPHGVTIEQIGGYSSNAVDFLLSNKMNVGEVASDTVLAFGQTKAELLLDVANITVNNSLTLDGLSVTQIVTLASTGGTSANSLLLNGETSATILQGFVNSGKAGALQSKLAPLGIVFDTDFPEIPITVVESWTKIGRFVPDVSNSTTLTSLSFILEGGASPLIEGMCPVALCSLTFDNAAWIANGVPDVLSAECTPLNGNLPGYDLYFGVSLAENGSLFSIDLWMKNKQLRNTVTVTELTGRFIQWDQSSIVSDVASVITNEPSAVLPFTSAEMNLTPSSLIDSFDSFTAALDNL